MSDNVEKPAHYNQGSVEAIDGIRAALGDSFLDYCRGNVLKYVWRCQLKGKLLEDLRKAGKYLEWAIEEAEKLELKSDAGNCPEIPEGWRELQEGELRQKTDMFEWNGEWVGYIGFDPARSVCAKYDKSTHAKHIRKIDPEVTARHDSDGRDVTDLPGLHDEGDTQYREPTHADLANGPIEVEVCDDGDPDGLWPTRKLYAVLPKQFEYPFIVATGHNDSCITQYKHARIKIEPNHEAAK